MLDPGEGLEDRLGPWLSSGTADAVLIEPTGAAVPRVPVGAKIRGAQSSSAQRLLIPADQLPSAAALRSALDFPGARLAAELPLLASFDGADGFTVVGTRGAGDWVTIPAGEGQIGSDHGGADEAPPWRVRFAQPFEMMRTEVTQAQYAVALGGAPPSSEEALLPQVRVSWDKARRACHALGGELPTEAQWEYAARAGSTGDYSLDAEGREITEANLAQFAWFSGSELHPVGTLQTNRWGLANMHGNAWEWVLDEYDDSAYKALSAPPQPREGEDLVESVHKSVDKPASQRVLRGGAFGNGPRDLRSAYRFMFLPSYQFINVGFRCVRAPRRQPGTLSP